MKAMIIPMIHMSLKVPVGYVMIILLIESQTVIKVAIELKGTGHRSGKIKIFDVKGILF